MVIWRAQNDPLVFDRKAVRRNRERAAPKFSGHDFLFQWSAGQLAGRLDDIRRTFPLALQIGSRSALSPALLNKKVGGILTLDCTSFPLTPCRPYVQAEEDALPFGAACLDLVLSNLDLHSVNDLPGALLQIRRSLRPDGLFLAAMPGGETLHELRDCLNRAEISTRSGLSPRVAPFADKAQMGALLQRAGFALPVVNSETLTVTYDHLFSLLQDLRHMGEGNAIAARDKTYAGKSLFTEAAKLYQDTYSEKDGRIAATFEIIFLIGWAPHESQQKPLRPGSAQHSLAEALGAQETKL